MNEVDLKKRAEELELTLHLQLAQFKKDSQTWIKVGGAVLAIALIATAMSKRKRKRKNKRSDYLKEVVQEPVQKIQKKAKSSSFFPPIKKRLFLALFSLGQTRLIEELKRRKEKMNDG